MRANSFPICALNNESEWAEREGKRGLVERRRGEEGGRTGVGVARSCMRRK